MLFISAEDFLTKASGISRLTREEEKLCAKSMAEGDSDARERLLNSYLPQVAAQVKRAPKQIQTLQTVYCCISTLEKSIDRFNFLQDSETFTHHLSRQLRQCIVRCIAEG